MNISVINQKLNFMKTLKFFIPLVSFLIIVSSACKRIEKLTEFYIDYETYVLIEGSGGINLPFNFFSPEVKSNAEAEFAVQGSEKERAKEIRLHTMQLSIVRPNNANFNFLKEIKIFLSAEGLSEIEIAGLSDIPNNNVAILNLMVKNNNLREYIVKDQFKLRAYAVTDENVIEDIEVKIYSNFFVKAGLIKRK